MILGKRRRSAKTATVGQLKFRKPMRKFRRPRVPGHPGCPPGWYPKKGSPSPSPGTGVCCRRQNILMKDGSAVEGEKCVKFKLTEK